MPQSIVWLLLLLWVQLFFAVHRWWSGDSYSDFGWIVPLAAGWFFWQRHRALPPSEVLPLEPPLLPFVLASTMGLAFLFVFRFVERSDPYWRIVIWLHAFTVAVIHHGILAWYRYPQGFAWITLFAWTAIPLPSSIERLVVDQFTDLLIGVSVFVANLQGLPILRNGNTLMANGEVLSINEGCSGVRSLQGLVMISLLCGELFRLQVAPRIALIATAPVFAFVGNAVRTVVLTWIFFKEGQEEFDFSHERVGTASFVCGVALTASAAWLLRKRTTP